MRNRAYHRLMTSALHRLFRIAEAVPIAGALFIDVRLQLNRALLQLVETLVRDHLDLDAIVAQLAIEDVVARLDINEIVRCLDVDEVVAQLEIPDVVARLDVDAIVARLDMDQIVARIDFGQLAGNVINDVNLSRKIRQSTKSLVRPHQPN
jgi:hypothetical protein